MPPAPRTERARALRQGMTNVERRLWSRLRMRQVNGWKFRRQAPIGPDYVVDFLCIAARLVIEVDGPSHDDARWQHDVDRELWLRSRGHRVVRFSADEVDERLDDVVEEVRQVLATEPPPRYPPRRAGRGL
jgi:very-short-patch-repair endonuclease